MPWQSPCWLSQDVSPFCGKLQKGFGCITMRSGCLSGFAENPFPLQGKSTHTRLSRSAKSQCKPLLPPSLQKRITRGSAQESLGCHLLSRCVCCASEAAEPSMVGQGPGQTSAPSPCYLRLCSCPCIAGREQSCLTLASGLGKEQRLSCVLFPAVQLDRTRS